METRSANTIVLMPDDSLLEVSYYCTDKKIEGNAKGLLTELIIQLHDCTCTMIIEKRVMADKQLLEKTIQNKVINTKGHLCC